MELPLLLDVAEELGHEVEKPNTHDACRARRVHQVHRRNLDGHLPVGQDRHEQSAGDLMADAGILNPDAFAEFIRTEYARWGKVIREAGIRME
jgi:hypothetical protein